MILFVAFHCQQLELLKPYITCSLVSFAAKPRSVRLRVSPYSQGMEKSNNIKSQTKWTLFLKENYRQFINNSPNLHLFMFSVLPLPKRDHQLDINFSLFQQISAGTFAKKKAWRKRTAFSCDMESGLKHLA